MKTLLTRERVIAYSWAALVGQLVAFASWIVACWVLDIRRLPPPGIDFRVFWSASLVSLHQGALAAFDPSALQNAEHALLQGTLLQDTFAPWVYPPPFQLLIYPLGLVSYPVAYLVWACFGIACALVACAPAMRSKPLPWVTIVAFTGIWVAVLNGQNSLLTLALAAGSLSLLEKRPVLAGVCAGLLVIKPQLAPIFPLLFLCGRHFRALAASAVTATLICLVSIAAFGAPLWLRFFDVAAVFNSAVLRDNVGDLWNSMPTMFAIARNCGFGIVPASVIHTSVALGAVALTVSIWIRKPFSELGNAAAVTTALLIPPYLLYYELVWLLLPILYLAKEFRDSSRGTLREYAILALAWASPLVSVLSMSTPFIGQSGALVSLALLAVIARRSLSSYSTPMYWRRSASARS